MVEMFIWIVGLHIFNMVTGAAVQPHGPQITAAPENHTAVVGESVTFVCETTDYANHSIGTADHNLTSNIHFDNEAHTDVADLYWGKEYHRTNKVRKAPGNRKLITETDVLTIDKEVNRQDKGWYHCESCIQAGHGACAEARFYLDIYEPPPPPTTAPMIYTTTPAGGPDDLVIEVDVARSTCQVFGDPHFLTYDKAPYTFMGSPCHYVLAMDAEAYSWFIYGTTTTCGLNGDGTCLSSVTLYYGRDAVTLERGWIINHQGKKIEPMLTPNEDMLIGDQFVANFDGSHLEVVATLSEVEEEGSKYFTRLVVRWDGYVSAFIQTPLETRVYGLCGDNDGDASNDLYTPRFPVSVAGSADEFGESWKVDSRGRCGELVAVQPVETICGDSLANVTEECERVFAISNFDKCGEFHEKQSFVDACVYDECKGINVRNILFSSETAAFDLQLAPKCVVAQAYALRCVSEYWSSSEGDVVSVSAGEVGGWEEEAGCPTTEEKKEIIPYQGCPQTSMNV